MIRLAGINLDDNKKIDIALKGDRVDRVIVSGHADGLHLEPRPPKSAADTTADSTRAAGTTRRPETR